MQLDLALAQQIALQVEQQRAHALGAIVDCQQVALVLVVIHGALFNGHSVRGVRQTMVALPQRPVTLFFRLPAQIVPAQPWLA
ncbi:hypothetical protein D3C76_1377680 [compost metagenome]